MKSKPKIKRYAESYKTRGGDSGNIGVMDWKKYDGDITFFSPKEGRNRINIVPFIIKTKNHPLVAKKRWDIGDADYVLDVYTHRSVGPTESTVLCLKQTYGKPCPICEQQQEFQQQGKQKEAASLKASRRVFYNIEDLKEPGKLKVFETSHYLFEKELIEEANADDCNTVDFADVESGKEIKFRCSKVSRGGFEFNEYKGFSFEERDENLDEKLVDAAISFDELLRVPTYEEAKNILFGIEDEGEDDEERETPQKTVAKEHVEEDNEEDEKPVRPARKRVEEEEEGDDEEDVDELEPHNSKKPVAKEDDEEDEGNDKEPEPKKPAKASKNCDGCPFGHCFGKDCDNTEDCDECNEWDKCVNAK